MRARPPRAGSGGAAEILATIDETEMWQELVFGEDPKVAWELLVSLHYGDHDLARRAMAV
jgi:hypothetical protein